MLPDFYYIETVNVPNQQIDKYIDISHLLDDILAPSWPTQSQFYQVITDIIFMIIATI